MQGTLKIFIITHDYTGAPPPEGRVQFTPDTCRPRRVTLFSRHCEFNHAEGMFRVWKELNRDVCESGLNVYGDFIPDVITL